MLHPVCNMRLSHIPGLDHFVLGRQVDPELEAPHHAILYMRHLAVDQTPACCHPLHPPWPNDALQTSATLY